MPERGSYPPHSTTESSQTVLTLCAKEIGAQNVVMGTDLGQTGNPSHIDGMKAMVAGLKANGVSEAQIKLVARDNAAAMLGV